MDNIIAISTIRVLFLALLDFSLCYFITNNLTGRKIKSVLKNFKQKDTLILFIFVSSILIQYLVFGSLGTTVFAWAAIASAFLVVTFFVIKNARTNYTFDECILILSIGFVIMLISSLIVHLLVLSVNSIILSLLISCILTLITLTIINKIDLNKLLIFVTHNLALKIIIFSASLFTLLLFIFLAIRFNLDTIATLIPLTILATSLIIGFISVLKIAHQYEIVVPEKYHDIKRILVLLNLRSVEAQTVDELQEMIDATIELMGIKTAKPETKDSENEPEDFESFIVAAIETLKLNFNSNVETRVNIQFFEPHKLINAMSISYMLGILLENSFETGTKNPILIDILSTEHVLFIKVANESVTKTPQEIENMFKKGYSTKDRFGRGFGLSKLKKLVESHEGTITTSQEMNTQGNTNYITFTLNF